MQITDRFCPADSPGFSQYSLQSGPNDRVVGDDQDTRVPDVSGQDLSFKLRELGRVEPEFDRGG